MGAWNFASAVSEDQIDIAGTEGRLTLSVFGNEPVRLAMQQASSSPTYHLCTSSNR